MNKSVDPFSFCTFLRNIVSNTDTCVKCTLPLNSQSSIITSREIRKEIIRVKDYREMITIESIKNQRKHFLDTFQNRKDFSSQNLVSNKTRTKERIISRVDVPTVSRSFQRG